MFFFAAGAVTAPYFLHIKFVDKGADYAFRNFCLPTMFIK